MRRAIIPAGAMFDVAFNCTRAPKDMPVDLEPREYATPGCIIGYIDGDPGHELYAMRSPRVRIHIAARLLQEVEP